MKPVKIQFIADPVPVRFYGHVKVSGYMRINGEDASWSIVVEPVTETEGTAALLVAGAPDLLQPGVPVEVFYGPYLIAIVTAV